MSQFFTSTGVAITSASREAIESHDVALKQIMGWDGDPMATISDSLKLDPDFVMGHCFNAVYHCFAGTRLNDAKVTTSIEAAVRNVANVTKRESMHVKAAEAWSQGKFHTAELIWEQISIKYPRDLLALKLQYTASLFLGHSNNLRDSVARVIDHWGGGANEYTQNKSRKYDIWDGYVMGLYAFGLEEMGQYDAALQNATAALQVNPADAWAAHSVAHVLESEGKQKEGIEFLTKTTNDWQQCAVLAGHLFWHKALYHIELEQFDRVLDLYEQHFKKHHVFDMVNTSSLLWRLELVGLDVSDKWEKLVELWKDHIGTHSSTFDDAHMMMAFTHSHDIGLQDTMLRSLTEYSQIADHDDSITNAVVSRNWGVPICKALKAYSQKQYDQVVDLLFPIRYDVQNLGGSHAQRDLFWHTLVHSSVRSNQNQIARALLSERLQVRPHSPQILKLYSKVLDSLGEEEMSATMLNKATSILNNSA